MKILQINNVYDRLSTGKIVADLHHEYQQKGHESFVAYARGPLVDEPRVYKFSWEFYAHLNKVRAMITGIPYGGNILSTYLLIKKIRQIQPDIVHLHCINDDSVNIYCLISFLKYNNIKTVVTLHAEFMHTGTCGYSYDCEKWKVGCGCCPQIKTMPFLIDRTRKAWKLMQKAFDGFNKDNICITSVSPWLMNRAKESPIMNEYKHYTVFNGIETSSFHRKKWDILDRNKLGLTERPALMYVTSHFPAKAKGGEYVIKLANLIPDIDIVVLGLCDNTVKVPTNIKLIGRVNNRDMMALYYSLCDATLLVSPRETFSMPVVESLCCGTPVVGFCAGGPESIVMKEYSTFVKYGDLEALKLAITEILSKRDFDKLTLSKKAIEMYSKERMANGYMKVYTQLIENK